MRISSGRHGWFLVVATLILALASVGCASHQNSPSTLPEPDQASLDPVQDEASADAAGAEIDTDEWLMDLVASSVRIAQGQIEPGEDVSDSPLDTLADVEPALTGGAKKTVEPVEAETIDFPVVINDQVRFWLEYYTERHPKQFAIGLARSGRYLPMFRRIFKEQGLPQDIIYMAHVESGYKTSAYSRARALGIWQFIASTARLYGLKIDYWVDERRDPEKSAYAAAAYLNKLYGDFGDWYLALAAYNGGEGRIKRALKRSGKTDFWGIAETRHIRRETKNYVPAIIAAVIISKDPAKYGLSFDPEQPLAYDSVQVDGAVDMQVLADCAGSDFETMRQLNPMLRKFQTPPHAITDVRVPVGQAATTLAALQQVPVEERVLYVRHRVRSGDTLSGLAKNYGVSVSAIQQTNEMGRRTMIREGKEIIIPTVAAGRYSDSRPSAVAASTTASGEVIRYRVRRGDNLWTISRRYGTNPASVAAASGISVNKLLHPGDRLVVVSGVRSPNQARRIASGESTVASAPAASSGARTYTVRRGDTLWRIASMHSTTVDRLCSLNGISQHATLYPGTRLSVAP